MDLIKKLSEEAREQVPKHILAVDEWIDCYNRIFATLIIKECGYLITQHQRKGHTTYASNLCEKFDIPYSNEDYCERIVKTPSAKEIAQDLVNSLNNKYKE